MKTAIIGNDFVNMRKRIYQLCESESILYIPLMVKARVGEVSLPLSYLNEKNTVSSNFDFPPFLWSQITCTCCLSILLPYSKHQHALGISLKNDNSQKQNVEYFICYLCSTCETRSSSSSSFLCGKDEDFLILKRNNVNLKHSTRNVSLNMTLQRFILTYVMELHDSVLKMFQGTSLGSQIFLRVLEGKLSYLSPHIKRLISIYFTEKYRKNERSLSETVVKEKEHTLSEFKLSCQSCDRECGENGSPLKFCSNCNSYVVCNRKKCVSKHKECKAENTKFVQKLQVL